MSSGILYRALLYTKNFGGKVVTFAKDNSMSSNAQVNEGRASINTGLKGDPAVAEWIEIERNIKLTEYTKVEFISLASQVPIVLS